jgi:hypothetical protein
MIRWQLRIPQDTQRPLEARPRSLQVALGLLHFPPIVESYSLLCLIPACPGQRQLSLRQLGAALAEGETIDR